MLRLSVLLCAVMFVSLLVAGKDGGQLRPGLAAAVAAGEEIVVLAPRRAAPAPVAEVVAPAPALALAEDLAAPVPAAAPVKPAVRAVTPAPVFTLSALPGVTVDPAPAAEPVAEVAAPAPAPDGEVWYVAADAVNVREGPSTDTLAIGRLTRGEAVTVAFEPGSEWAHVSIEGDGLEGWIALRLLSPEAP